MDKDVKQSFRYGSDTIYELNDGTIIMKKGNGESLILKSDDSMEIIDKDGQVVSTKDDDKKVSINLNDKKFKQLKIKDNLNNIEYYINKNSRITRENNKL